MISAESVKDRLRNYAAVNGKSMQEILIAYGLERTIYRLSVSEYAERFTLKGGVFLYALFNGDFMRVTRDIDLLAMNTSNSVSRIRRMFTDIFSIQTDDALRYDLNTLEVRTITEFKEYHGVNVLIMSFLDRTRIPVSIDIGFGDTVYPDRVRMEFPVLLDMPVPLIHVYSIESVVAEKFEAIVSLGDANSRYKDFYDIYMLAERYTFQGELLQAAIQETFSHRQTTFDDIYAFKDDFLKSGLHQRRWNAFLTKKSAAEKISLEETIMRLKGLLLPIVESMNEEKILTREWCPDTQSWV